MKKYNSKGSWTVKYKASNTAYLVGTIFSCKISKSNAQNHYKAMLLSMQGINM